MRFGVVPVGYPSARISAQSRSSLVARHSEEAAVRFGSARDPAARFRYRRARRKARVDLCELACVCGWFLSSSSFSQDAEDGVTDVPEKKADVGEREGGVWGGGGGGFRRGLLRGGFGRAVAALYLLFFP